MVDSGTVSNDSSSLGSVLDNYNSMVSGVSSSWKGTSHDSFESKANEFVSSFRGSITTQMNSFANACALLKEYIDKKNTLATVESNYYQAINNNDRENQAVFANDITTLRDSLNTLKGQIESQLSAASSPKLEATQLSSSIATNYAGTTAAGTTAGQNPDLIYSSSNPGYVFPFAKGVDAPVTSHVGYRDAPTAGASTNHQGTDIAAANGSEIHAIASGTVVTAGEFGGYGNCVRIQQDDGNLTYYGHCSNVDYFSEGDRVNAGDVIGNVGSTGVSTGPHLHLEIRGADYEENGTLLDSEEIFSDCWPA